MTDPQLQSYLAGAEMLDKAMAAKPVPLTRVQLIQALYELDTEDLIEELEARGVHVCGVF